MMKSQIRWLSHCLLALAMCLIAAPAKTHSQDAPHRVRLAPRIDSKISAQPRWYPQALSTLVGQVQQVDAQQLSILVEGDRVPTRIAASRVLSIDVSEIPSDQQSATKAFYDGNYADALPALIRSISDRESGDRPAVWRQQWLSMLAAQAAMRSGRGEIALELVEQLDARPLPAFVLAILPVDWIGKVGAIEPMVDVAAKRASSKSLAVKLVAASWLLRSPKYRAPAKAALERLASNTQRREIALLAQQLLWRTKTPPEIQSGIAKWESELNGLPMVLRTGPLISMLHQVRQAGMKEQAKRLELGLELAAPTWHPDLPALAN